MSVYLSYGATLIFYDNHQVVMMTDQLETRYICLLVSETEEDCLYCCVPLSPNRYSSLVNNKVDLREVMVNRETEEWYTLKTANIVQERQLLEVHGGAIIDSYLPDSGFIVSPTSVSNELLACSRERHNIVSELTIEPANSGHNAIGARALAELIDAYQSLIRRAVTANKRGKKPSDKAMPNSYQIDVFAFSPGSFKVRCEARAKLDLLGDSDIESALDIIGQVLSSSNSIEKTTHEVERYKGHFVSCLIRLLTVAEQSDTYLKVSWAKPSFREVKSVIVERQYVSPLIQALSAKEEMARETVTVTGTLTKADSSRGVWRIEEGGESKEEYSGRIMEQGPSLAGLEIDARYSIECIEQIEQAPLTMKEDIVLYATKFTRLSN